MTVVGHKPTMRTVAELLAGKALRVGWSSIGRDGEGLGRTEFVLSVEVAGGDSVVAEAWVERGGIREPVLPREQVAAEIVREREFTHLDAMVNGPDGWRIAVSVARGHGDHEAPHLVYAQTSLLGKAGFEAGRYGPPAMTMSSL